MEYEFELVRTAKGSGGDRYHNSDYDWTIYIPQELSRESNDSESKVIKKLTVTVKTADARGGL
jgi:uncharacterized phage infection (PIP) family protein YhgE